MAFPHSKEWEDSSANWRRKVRKAILLISLMLTLVFVGEAQALKQKTRSTESIIRQVFGRYGDQAVKVAWCESRFSVWARNGQYLGLFQMGNFARGRYGHSWNAWGQARAAYRYFIESGRDWSPWACKPW